MANYAGILQTRVVWKDAFLAVGEKIRFDPSADVPPSENEIFRLWNRFNERVGEIEHIEGGMYGLCLLSPDCKPDDPFDYVAAVGVSRAERVPEGMTVESVPGGLYCVVTRRGVIDEIGAAFRYFWDEWLPQSGYVFRDGAEFEYYDERYRGNHDPESVMDIWFPIRPAQPVPLENRIASAFVHVTDLRRSAEWYSRLLGLPVLEERLNGGPVYWFDLPGTHLILDTNAANRQNPAWREEMMPRFMLPAADIDDAYRYVQAKAEPLFEPERHGALAYFNFRDPEGNALMACWTAQPAADGEFRAESPVLPRIGGVFADAKDTRRAARWYADLFGLPYEEESAERPIHSVPVTRGAALLLNPNRETSTPLFYVETENADRALAYVREHGFQVAGELDGFRDSGFVLLDPDGNRIAVAQMNRPAS